MEATKKQFNHDRSIDNIITINPAPHSLATANNIKSIKQDQTNHSDDQTELATCVKQSLEKYFSHLDGHTTMNLYELVINEIEKPMFETVLEHCGGNQSKAALTLGMNRGTFRKKLKAHDLLD
ncbi:MAG: hypothetical protein D6B28_05750 [Gammaproteobacteria bacterium]|nr:MAG: hypothetical protein D6B28_05750 [Gammaproteobacteria bacterium]